MTDNVVVHGWLFSSIQATFSKVSSVRSVTTTTTTTTTTAKQKDILPTKNSL
jgi:hypothetical protein